MLSKPVRWQLAQLDALRGIAVLNVLLVHSVYWGPDRILVFRYPWLTEMFFAGQRGVQLFFIVSAFTLFMSHDHRSEERSPTRNFFLRRFFRIAPMFYVSTVITLLLWRQMAGPVRDVILSVCFLNGFSAGAIMHGAVGSWSIATEAAFYLCLPLLYRCIRSFRSAIIAFAVALLIRLITVLSMSRLLTAHDYWNFSSITGNAPTFALGIVLYYFWRDHVRDAGLDRAAARRLSAVSLLICLGAYIESPPRSADLLIVGSLMHFFLTLGLLLYPWGLLVNRFTVFMGEISFSFYLLHFYVAHEIELFLERRYAGTFLFAHTLQVVTPVLFGTFVGTLPLAYLCRRYVEQPGVQMGKRLIRKLEASS